MLSSMQQSIFNRTTTSTTTQKGGHSLLKPRQSISSNSNATTSKGTFPLVQSNQNGSTHLKSNTARLPRLSTPTDDKIESSNSNNLSQQQDPSGLEVGTCSVQGRRPYQEDQYAVCKNLKDAFNQGDVPETHFFGVFDGHAGAKCSKAICTTIPQQLVRDEAFASKLQLAIKRSIQRTNEQFLEIAGRMRLNDGSTGVCVLLREKSLIVANVGDSRAILVSGHKPIPLTEDHKPSLPSEQKRIASFGGTVTYNTGIARVAGVLAVSRAFGNYTIRNLIRADPDIIQRDLTSEDHFIVIASDGLWDVFRNSEVVDVCYSMERSGVQKIADHLVQMSLSRGSMDNVTCVVINLQKYVMRMAASTSDKSSDSKPAISRYSSEELLNMTMGAVRGEISAQISPIKSSLAAEKNGAASKYGMRNRGSETEQEEEGDPFDDQGSVVFDANTLGLFDAGAKSHISSHGIKYQRFKSIIPSNLESDEKQFLPREEESKGGNSNGNGKSTFRPRTASQMSVMDDPRAGAGSILMDIKPGGYAQEKEGSLFDRNGENHSHHRSQTPKGQLNRTSLSQSNLMSMSIPNVTNTSSNTFSLLGNNTNAVSKRPGSANDHNILGVNLRTVPIHVGSMKQGRYGTTVMSTGLGHAQQKNFPILAFTGSSEANGDDNGNGGGQHEENVSRSYSPINTETKQPRSLGRSVDRRQRPMTSNMVYDHMGKTYSSYS